MNIWLSSLRIRAHLSWRTGKHLQVLHVLRTYSTCSCPGQQDTKTYAALLLQVSQLLIVGLIMLCSCTFYHQKNPCVSLCCHHHKSECIFLQVSSKLPNTIGVHLAIGTTIITWTPGVLIRARNWWKIAQIKQGWWNLRRFFPSHYLAGNHGGSLWKWVLCPSPTSSVELVWESWPL